MTLPDILMTVPDAKTIVAAAATLPAMAVQPVGLVTLEAERADDVAARERLLDEAFGPARFAKTCQKLRLGRLPARGLSLVARYHGEVVGTVRLWHVAAGGAPALMLGPLAVDERFRTLGIGAMLMRESIERAQALGHRAILLVGDAPYYARFGFERRNTSGLRMPGPVDSERLLGLELQPGALSGARGSVRPTGATDLAARRQDRPRRQRLRAAA